MALPLIFSGAFVFTELFAELLILFKMLSAEIVTKAFFQLSLLILKMRLIILLVVLQGGL